jgi:hypothetical protein
LKRTESELRRVQYHPGHPADGSGLNDSASFRSRPSQEEFPWTAGLGATKARALLGLRPRRGEQIKVPEQRKAGSRCDAARGRSCFCTHDTTAHPLCQHYSFARHELNNSRLEDAMAGAAAGSGGPNPGARRQGLPPARIGSAAGAGASARNGWNLTTGLVAA